MKGRMVLVVGTILLLLFPLVHCQKSATAAASVKTLYKALNKTHHFTIKSSVEYYVKFTVPEKVIKRLEKEKDKHIFQVRRAETTV